MEAAAPRRSLRRRWRLRRSNCLIWSLWFFAFKACPFWARNPRRCRDYPRWTCRPSRHITGLHWMAMHPKFGRWIHYEPITPKNNPARAAIDKLFYRGRIRRDDPYEAPA